MTPEVLQVVGQVAGYALTFTASVLTAWFALRSRKVDAQSSPYGELAGRVTAQEQQIAKLLDESREDRNTIAALRQRVEAITVMTDLGPKLLAALESLGASPAAAAKLAGKAPPAPPGGTPKSRLSDLRARHGGA